MSIRLEHVSHVYGADTELSVAALKDICLTIGDGEFIGLIGHTGSGKSTLVQHLNGLLKATDGKIYYNEADIYEKGYNLKELRSKVGLVFQYPEHQLFEIDVFTDVCFGPKNLGLSGEEVEERARDVYKRQTQASREAPGAAAMSGRTRKWWKRSPASCMRAAPSSV